MPDRSKPARKAPAKKAPAKKKPAGKRTPRKAVAGKAAAKKRSTRLEPSVAAAEIPGETVALESYEDVPEPVIRHTDTYLKSLLLLLVAATFFEGYDGAILALVLGDIRDTFGVGESQLGVSRAIIELGLGAAFFLARAGDRWGRKKLLLWSVLGYTVMTTLTAFSFDLWSFTAFQSLSRVFLGAEYAVAITMIVEEFPKERRARAIGTLLMCSAIGAVAVALLLLGGVAGGPLEWRTLYLVGIVPLIFLAFFRRRLKETRRFEEHAASVASGGGSLRMSFFEPWRAKFRRTLVLVGLVHLLRSLPLFGATSWFFYYAEREAGLGETALYLIFIVSYGFGTVGYLVCGRLMDAYGRRPTAIGYGVLAAAASIALFQARGTIALGLLLVVSVFFGLGMAPVLGAISTELFPTYIRNQAAAWARNIFEIAGFILGPLLVGVLGDHYTGALGSVGDTVSLLLFLFIPATWLIWRHLPETKGRELEEIEADLGLHDVRDEPEPSAAWRPWAIVAGALAVLLFGGVFAVRGLGDITRRPEGAAERFLQAIDSEEPENVERYGSAYLAGSLFGARVDDLDFDRIEIGRERDGKVPFRVEIEDADQPAEGYLVVGRTTGEGSTGAAGDDPPEFEVLGVDRAALEGDLERRSGAPSASWPVAIGLVILLTLVSEAVLRATKVS
jgi:MFS family permease